MEMELHPLASAPALFFIQGSLGQALCPVQRPKRRYGFQRLSRFLYGIRWNDGAPQYTAGSEVPFGAGVASTGKHRCDKLSRGILPHLHM